MKKAVAISDIHLDFIDKRIPECNNIQEFCNKVLSHNPDYIFLTGDISNARLIEEHLGILAKSWKDVPVFFILGNHDFYHGSFATVGKVMERVCLNHKNLHYMTQEGIIKLTDHTSLCGHDGWYDGQYANWWSPTAVIMNDYVVIKEFNPYDFKNLTMVLEPSAKKKIYDLMQVKATECANHIKKYIPLAYKDCNNVIFLTHVPPFKESAIYRGKMSDNNWMPSFSSKIAGDALKEVMVKLPDRLLTVLCGHTHGSGVYKHKNITCVTSHSEYNFPESSIQVIDID